jgi:hypothetical protein
VFTVGRLGGRPRQYRAVETATGWALEGDCTCSESEPYGRCGAWHLLAYRWPTQDAAETQAGVWTARQQLLLEAAGPQQDRPRKPAA